MIVESKSLALFWISWWCHIDGDFFTNWVTNHINIVPDTDSILKTFWCKVLDRRLNSGKHANLVFMLKQTFSELWRMVEQLQPRVTVSIRVFHSLSVDSGYIPVWMNSTEKNDLDHSNHRDYILQGSFRLDAAAAILECGCLREVGTYRKSNASVKSPFRKHSIYQSNHGVVCSI